MAGSLSSPTTISDAYKKLTFLDDENYLSNDDGSNDINIPEVNFNRISTETSNEDPVSLTVTNGFNVITSLPLASSGVEVLTLGLSTNPSYFLVGSEDLYDKVNVGDSIQGYWEPDDTQNENRYRVITSKANFGGSLILFGVDRDFDTNDLGIEIGPGRTGGLQPDPFNCDFEIYRKNFAVVTGQNDLQFNCDQFGGGQMPSLSLTGSNTSPADKRLIYTRGEPMDYTYVKDSIGKTDGGSFTFLGQSLEDTTNYGSWIEIEVNGSTKLIRTYDAVESPP